MKQAGYSKRPYGRSSERPKQSNTKQSTGTFAEGKMRVNPQQYVEKYLTLARDATSSGDPIAAENYYQFADHYYRLVIAHRASRSPQPEKKIEKKSPAESPPLLKQAENWLE